MYVIVPPNCTDRLQPLDIIQLVDLRLSVVKPIRAQWMVEL